MLKSYFGDCLGVFGNSFNFLLSSKKQENVVTKINTDLLVGITFEWIVECL